MCGNHGLGIFVTSSLFYKAIIVHSFVNMILCRGCLVSECTPYRPKNVIGPLSGSLSCNDFIFYDVSISSCRSSSQVGGPLVYTNQACLFAMLFYSLLFPVPLPKAYLTFCLPGMMLMFMYIRIL